MPCLRAEAGLGAIDQRTPSAPGLSHRLTLSAMAPARIAWSGGPDRDAWVVEQETSVVIGQHAREIKRRRGIGKTPTGTLVLEANVALLETFDTEILYADIDAGRVSTLPAGQPQPAHGKRVGEHR
jgi:hypothetical protein